MRVQLYQRNSKLTSDNVVKHWSNDRGNKPTVSAEDRNQTTESNLTCSAGVETCHGGKQ